ncbi:MAG: saccharopine dehydrogenase [Chloroflexi bacterium]|nr:saccharopine dehydrogenase [Chloroflexota bacterium]
MNVVVLGGCGDMGSAVVRELLAHSEATVTIADYRVQQAEEMAGELGERAGAAFVDANDPASLRSVLKGADAAVGCIGPFYTFAAKMARAAVEAEVNYVDICDDYGPIAELFALDEAAKRAGVTVITGLGWTPGITNLLARRAAEELDEVEDIKLSWAGGAADSTGLAVIMHVFYAVTGNVPTYQDGAWVEVPAGSGGEVVEFPAPLGRVRVYHCGHPEPLTVPRYIEANTVSLKGALTPDWNNKLTDLFARLGLIGTPARNLRLARIIHTIEGVFRVGGIAVSGARVDVRGRKDGQPRTISYGVADKMGRLTGIPAAIGGQLLAEGKIEEKGVFAPEGCIAPQPFLDELSQRGIEIHRLD